MRQRKKAFTASLRKKNDIVSPYKRNKMLCAHAVNSQCEDIGTHTALRILGSGHCGGVGAQRIEIYIYTCTEREREKERK